MNGWRNSAGSAARHEADSSKTLATELMLFCIAITSNRIIICSTIKTIFMWTKQIWGWSLAYKIISHPFLIHGLIKQHWIFWRLVHFLFHIALHKQQPKLNSHIISYANNISWWFKWNTHLMFHISNYFWCHHSVTAWSWSSSPPPP